MDNISEFLTKLKGATSGNEESGKDTALDTDKWLDIIKPETVNLILGKKGKGKSALGYWLLEILSAHYGLCPLVINLPKEKQNLLPPNFKIGTLKDIKDCHNSVILIDEGTTMLPAGQAKLEEMIKGFQALSRQRNQIFVLIFHASKDVGSRLLRGMDALLVKEPSQRQIQHGSKDAWWGQLLIEAKEKFTTITQMGDDPRCYTYVDSEEPEFRGLLRNPLATFWCDELSKAWANVQMTYLPSEPEPTRQPQVGERIGWRKLPDGSSQKGEDGKYLWVTPEMKERAEIVEVKEFAQSRYIIYRDPMTDIYWITRG